MTDYTISPPASEILARAAPPLFSLNFMERFNDDFLFGSALARGWRVVGVDSTCH